MSTFHFSAPANIMLCGEHSVVYGAPAIVAAINQRLHLHLTPRSDREIHIDSNLAHYHSTLDTLPPHPKLHPLLTILRHERDQKTLTHGLHLRIYSQINPTLGLGSSAALTIALTAALNRLHSPNLNLTHIHQQALEHTRRIQTLASGADLAASLHGTLHAYQLNPTRIDPLPINQPFQLSLRYSGYKTPTAEVLAKIAHNMQQQPEHHQHLYQQMAHTTQTAINALKSHQPQMLYRALNHYQTLLVALGVSDPTLERLITEATPQSYASKISGSGLGDCIVSLSAKNAPPPTHHTPISLAPQGLIHHTP